MKKKTTLRPFKIYFDKQADIWVARDLDTGYASQAETRERAEAALIEALRLVILTFLENWPKAQGPRVDERCGCDDYKWLQKQLGGQAVFLWAHGQGLKENRGSFKFCPYCGKRVKGEK